VWRSAYSSSVLRTLFIRFIVHLLDPQLSLTSAFHLQELRFRIIGGDKECMDLVKELAQKVPANAESVSE
jgi:hypothetical protein